VTTTSPGLPKQVSALRELAGFPPLEALYGRRARRVALGAQIPDGPLAYESQHDPMSLSDLERMVILTSMAGTTGWHYSITRNAHYAPHMANYAAGAAGRTFPWRPASTPPSCSSRTTRGPTSSPPGTPARWSTRPTRRSLLSS
jgi:hypothetical protein